MPRAARDDRIKQKAGEAMELSLQQIRYLRLYKQGLIKPFENLAELFATLEIQAQNENDAFFNVARRMQREVTVEAIQQAAIRVWYVRNTIFLMGRQHYDKAVFVNNVIDNWFRRMRIVTDQDEEDLRQIIGLCKDKDFVCVDDLVALGCNKSFIRVWSGAFIEMVRRGYLRSKYKNSLEINHAPICTDFSLDDIMRQYFDVYGPATLRDFKHWLGKTSPEVSDAFERIRGEYRTVNGKMLLSPRDLPLLEAPGDIPLIITGKFDPICLSYQDKTWLIAKEHNAKVWGKAGIVEAVILVNGEIVATWRRDKEGVKVYPVTKLTKTLQTKIASRFRKILGRHTQVTFC